jgi:hypothetical protein
MDRTDFGVISIIDDDDDDDDSVCGGSLRTA